MSLSNEILCYPREIVTPSSRLESWAAKAKAVEDELAEAKLVVVKAHAVCLKLEAALQSLVVNVDLAGHLGLHPDHPSVGRARKLLLQSETPEKSRPSFSGWIQAPCQNCGKLSTEHPGIEMWCPTETKGDASG